MVIFTTDPVYSVPRQKNINPDKEEICQSDCLKGREDGLQRGYTGNWRANKKTDLFFRIFFGKFCCRTYSLQSLGKAVLVNIQC